MRHFFTCFLFYHSYMLHMLIANHSRRKNMKVERQDAWTEDEDIILAEITLRYIREGRTQLDAFQAVSKKLSRTPAACGFRWNSTVRKQYREAIRLAKQERKRDLSSVSQYMHENSFQKNVQQAISILSDIKNISFAHPHSTGTEDISTLHALKQENEQLKRKIERYEEAWEEMGKLWSWIRNENH